MSTNRISEKSQKIEYRSDLKEESSPVSLAQHNLTFEQSNILPPVSELCQLEDLRKGSVNDLFDLLQVQTAHRINLENKKLEQDIEIQKQKLEIEKTNCLNEFGLKFLISCCAILFLFSFSVAGLVFLALGRTHEGAICFSVPFCAIAVSLINGIFKNKKDS